MPITARCPYCREYKVRAPDFALGQSVTCKKCQNSFTLVETEQEAPKPTSLHPSALGVKPQPVADPPSTEIPSTPTDELREIEISAEPEVEIPDETPAEAAKPEFAGRPQRRVERSLPVALVAFVAGSVGLMLSQTGLAHFGAVGAAGVGLTLAVISLTIVRQRWVVPIVAAGFNVLILAVVILLPGWLNLRSWRPSSNREDTETVFAVGHDGVPRPPDEWIDASKLAWQRGSVRVSVGRVVVEPVELTGPDGKKWMPKESYVHFRVRVKNVGVFGSVSLKDWAPGAIRLTDSAGSSYPRKAFEPGWEPSGRIAPAKLGPSESAECLLFFDAVPTNVTYLRLEVSGEMFGAPGVVRLQIPWLMIQFRPTP
jgi:hypothetical protein